MDTDTRLRVGRAIGKTEEEVAHDLMAQLKERGQKDAPPAMATDGKGEYREALVETWGQVPDIVPDVVGAHTAYVERTNLTSRQMNGRLVRKTLSYSKQLDALTASCAWEDWVVGLHAAAQDAGDAGAGKAAPVAEANTRDGRWIDRSPIRAIALAFLCDSNTSYGIMGGLSVVG